MSPLSGRFLTLQAANGEDVMVNFELVSQVSRAGDGVRLYFAHGTSLVVRADFDRLATLISWEPDWREVASVEAGAA